VLRDIDFGTNGYIYAIDRKTGTRQDVEEISHMAEQNVNIAKLAVSQLGQLSDVAEGNVRISHNTKEVSADMVDITDNLLNLIEG